MENTNIIENFKEDNGKDEWINGIKYMSPSADPNHGITLIDIATQIKIYLKGKSCRIFADRTDLILKSADSPITVEEYKKPVVPDIFIFCDNKIERMGNNVLGIPDFILEVLSPGSIKKDLIDKKKMYLDAGVKEYWVVDYLEKGITKFYNGKEVYYGFEEKVKIEILENLEIDLSEIEKEFLE